MLIRVHLGLGSHSERIYTEIISPCETETFQHTVLTASVTCQTQPSNPWPSLAVCSHGVRTLICPYIAAARLMRDQVTDAGILGIL